MGLTPQDAYYWQYAKHPAIGYFDHPPMHAFTAATTTAVFGDNAFGIRFGPWLYSLGILLLLWDFTKRLFGERQAFWAVLIAGVTPLFSIGSGVLTPDPPLLFFWTLSIYLGYRALSENRKSWWLLVGFAGGLAMLSKYTAVFLAAGFAMALIFTREGRRHLRSPWPYLAVLAAGAAFSPQIIWNAQNDWASFAFQSTRRAGELSRWRLDLFGGMLASQLLVVSPIIFGGVLWASARGLFNRMPSESASAEGLSAKSKYLYLSAFSLPTIAFFTAVSLRYWVKMNWLAPAYITGLVALVGLAFECGRPIKWLKVAVSVAAFETVALYFLVLVPIFPLSGEAAYWDGWRELSVHVDSLRAEMPERTFVAGWGYKVPSELRFYLEGRPETYSNEVLGRHGLNYSYWTNTEELLGRDCIFVADAREPFREEGLLAEYFDSVAAPDTLRPTRGGKAVTTYRIWRCFGYTGR